MTPKKILGRPKLPKGEAKTEILQIRLTKAERDAVQKIAESKGHTLSELFRKMIMGS
jgi:DNA-binding protein YbaB